MIKLFNLENYEVIVEPEALLLAPFKALWSRDKIKNKSNAKQEFAYIYFMGDPRSDYQYIMDEEVRSDEIIKGLGMPPKWKPDKAVLNALEFYKSFKPISSGLLEDTKIFVDGFRKELRKRSSELDSLEVRDLKEVMALIKQIPALAKDLDEAERTLSKDIIQEDKIRGTQTKSILEDED